MTALVSVSHGNTSTSFAWGTRVYTSGGVFTLSSTAPSAGVFFSSASLLIPSYAFVYLFATFHCLLLTCVNQSCESEWLVDSQASVSMWLSQQLSHMSVDKWAGSAVADVADALPAGAMWTPSLDVTPWPHLGPTLLHVSLLERVLQNKRISTTFKKCIFHRRWFHSFLFYYFFLTKLNTCFSQSTWTSDFTELKKYFPCLRQIPTWRRPLLQRCRRLFRRRRRGSSATTTWTAPTSAITFCHTTPPSRSAAARWERAGETTVRSTPVLL